MSLMLHCGSHEKSLDAIGQVALPERTKSYSPVGHRQLVDMVRQNVEGAGLSITSEQHGLWGGGERYFGVMGVQKEGLGLEDFQFVIGLRNSYDKSLPAGVCSGKSVFVCDNLAFSGTFNFGRKHGSMIWDFLPAIIHDAINKIVEGWDFDVKRVEAYKNTGICDSQAHDLIVRAYREHNILTKKMVAEVIDQWHSPNHPEFADRNLWSLENDFTECLKGRADLLVDRCDAMYAMLDEVCGFGSVIDVTDS